MTQNSEVEATTWSSLGNQTLQTAKQEPQSESERYLAQLWMEIVGLEDVWRHSKFLEVGGNSLSLNIILNRVQNERGVALPPQQFFDAEQSSLSDIARALDAMLSAERWPLERGPR